MNGMYKVNWEKVIFFSYVSKHIDYFIINE